jgi:hypothetical protein
MAFSLLNTSSALTEPDLHHDDPCLKITDLPDVVDNASRKQISDDGTSRAFDRKQYLLLLNVIVSDFRSNGYFPLSESFLIVCE